MVYADVELVNADDLGMVRRGFMDKDEVRRMPVNIMVDTWSFSLAINEGIAEALQLTVIDRTSLTLASGEVVVYDIVSPVQIKFGNRKSTCVAVVLPGNSEPLLGAIPLEEMDLIVHPKQQTLLYNPAHGEEGLWRI